MRGFTLIEVVVAIVLLEIGMLGILGTLVIASRTMSQAETIEAAVIAVERVADSLSAYGMGGEGGLTFPWGTVSWSTGHGHAEVVALGGPGAALARSVVVVAR